MQHDSPAGAELQRFIAYLRNEAPSVARGDMAARFVFRKFDAKNEAVEEARAKALSLHRRHGLRTAPPDPDPILSVEDAEAYLAKLTEWALGSMPIIPPSSQTAASGDFTSVRWFGKEYTFALGVQSTAVRELWVEWKRTGMGLNQNTIRLAVDANRDTFRMDKAFRDHPALGTMIQSVGGGIYRLVPPVDPAAGHAKSKPKISARIPSKAPRKPR